MFCRNAKQGRNYRIARKAQGRAFHEVEAEYLSQTIIRKWVGLEEWGGKIKA
jgi:hypothetical protein